MTNIKERVLYFIENQGEKKETFFEDLGMSYANFKGVQKKSALGSDKIDKILSKYPNLLHIWHKPMQACYLLYCCYLIFLIYHYWHCSSHIVYQDD